MSKLLRQLRRHFHQNSSVNDNRFNRATKDTRMEKPMCDGKGISFAKYSIPMISAALFLIVVNSHNIGILKLAKEVTCGRVTSTTRIVGQIEMHTEVEKSCVGEDSKPNNKHYQEK